MQKFLSHSCQLPYSKASCQHLAYLQFAFWLASCNNMILHLAFIAFGYFEFTLLFWLITITTPTSRVGVFLSRFNCAILLYEYKLCPESVLIPPNFLLTSTERFSSWVYIATPQVAGQRIDKSPVNACLKHQMFNLLCYPGPQTLDHNFQSARD